MQLFGLAYFTPSIVNALGFSADRTQLLTVSLSLLSPNPFSNPNPNHSSKLEDIDLILLIRYRRTFVRSLLV